MSQLGWKARSMPSGPLLSGGAPMAITPAIAGWPISSMAICPPSDHPQTTRRCSFIDSMNLATVSLKAVSV